MNPDVTGLTEFAGEVLKTATMKMSRDLKGNTHMRRREGKDTKENKIDVEKLENGTATTLN